MDGAIVINWPLSDAMAYARLTKGDGLSELCSPGGRDGPKTSTPAGGWADLAQGAPRSGYAGKSRCDAHIRRLRFPALPEQRSMGIEARFNWSCRGRARVRRLARASIPPVETHSRQSHARQSGYYCAAAREREKAVCAMIDYGQHGRRSGIRTSSISCCSPTAGMDPRSRTIPYVTRKQDMVWPKQTDAHNTVTITGHSPVAHDGSPAWFEKRREYCDWPPPRDYAYHASY